MPRVRMTSSWPSASTATTATWKPRFVRLRLREEVRRQRAHRHDGDGEEQQRAGLDDAQGEPRGPASGAAAWVPAAPAGRRGACRRSDHRSSPGYKTHFCPPSPRMPSGLRSGGRRGTELAVPPGARVDDPIQRMSPSPREADARDHRRRGGRASLAPGDWLPRETDLARQFGVSRGVARECIRGPGGAEADRRQARPRRGRATTSASGTC